MNTRKIQLDLGKQTTRQIVKDLLLDKIKSELRFEELRKRNVKKFKVPYIGQIYSIPEHLSKSLDKRKLLEDLGDKLQEYEKVTTVKEHYCMKPTR